MSSDLSLKKSENVDKPDILTRIQNYAKTNPFGLVILTPCYGSQCYVNYVSSLLNTMTLFSKLGLSLRVEFCKNDSLVSRARNNLIAKAMHDKTTTHMLFIDADITWNPVDIIKLVLADKNIVGGVYPIKNYEWEKLVEPGKNVVEEWIEKKRNSELSAVVSDKDIIQHRLMRYNLNYLGNTLEIINNLTKVRHLATGFMMIRRDTIEKMSRAFPSTNTGDL